MKEQNPVSRVERGRWAKGTRSPNPRGRPKVAVSIAAGLRELGALHDPKSKAARVMVLAERVWKYVLDESVPFLERFPVVRDLLDRIDGRPIAALPIDEDAPMGLIFQVGVKRIEANDGDGNTSGNDKS